MLSDIRINDEILVDGLWLGVDTNPDKDGYFFASDKWGEHFELNVRDVEDVNRVLRNDNIIFDYDVEDLVDDRYPDNVDWGF